MCEITAGTWSGRFSSGEAACIQTMAKRSSKRRKQSRLLTRPVETQPPCPYCGTGISEKSALSLLDQLLRSHAELCVTLRSAGRQMLQHEKQSDGSLERIRHALKRAENIRKALPSREGDELPVAPKDADDLVGDALRLASDLNPDQALTGGTIRKNAPQRAHLNRPRSLRVIRFPTA